VFDTEHGRMQMAFLEAQTSQPKSTTEYKSTTFEFSTKDIHPIDQMEMHKQTGEMISSTLTNTSMSIQFGFDFLGHYTLTNLIVSQGNFSKLFERIHPYPDFGFEFWVILVIFPLHSTHHTPFLSLPSPPKPHIFLSAVSCRFPVIRIGSSCRFLVHHVGFPETACFEAKLMENL